MTQLATPFGSHSGRRPLFPIALIVALVVSLISLSPTLAQWPWQRDEPDSVLGKDNALLRGAASSQVTEASAATLQLYIEGEEDSQPAALATVVSEDGFVLTKASEIDATVTADVPTDQGLRRVEGRIVGVARDHDLAAVKLNLPPDVRLVPLSFDNAVSTLDAGSWLLSVDAAGDTVVPPAPLAIGNLSVTGVRTIEPSGLQLGIGMGPGGQSGVPISRVFRGGAADQAGLEAGDLIIARDGEAVGTQQDFLRRLRFDQPDARFVLTISRDGRIHNVPVMLMAGRLDMEIAPEVAGVYVLQVFPGSAAEEAGLQARDLITEVNETPVRDGPSLREALADFKAGDRLTLDVIREGAQRTLNVQVGDSGRSLRARIQNHLGGTTISRRAVDFPAVLQHDTILSANEMGGPVVDIHGNVVGINIARAGRVETYALPAGIVQELLPRLLSGQMSPATEPATDDLGLPPPQEPLR